MLGVARSLRCLQGAGVCAITSLGDDFGAKPGTNGAQENAQNTAAIVRATAPGNMGKVYTRESGSGGQAYTQKLLAREPLHISK